MGLTTYAKNQLMSLLVGRTYYTFGGNMYLGLSTTEPNESGQGVTEPVGNGYERVLIGSYGSSATYKMSDPVDGVSTNSSAILFPRAKADWGTITHVVFYTQATGGSLIGFSKLREPKPVPMDYVANFDVGAITLTIDNKEEESGN